MRNEAERPRPRPRPTPGNRTAEPPRRRLGRLFAAGQPEHNGTAAGSTPNRFPGVPSADGIPAEPAAPRPRPKPGSGTRPRPGAGP